MQPAADAPAANRPQPMQPGEERDESLRRLQEFVQRELAKVKEKPTQLQKFAGWIDKQLRAEDLELFSFQGQAHLKVSRTSLADISRVERTSEEIAKLPWDAEIRDVANFLSNVLRQLYRKFSSDNVEVRQNYDYILVALTDAFLDMTAKKAKTSPKDEPIFIVHVGTEKGEYLPGKLFHHGPMATQLQLSLNFTCDPEAPPETRACGPQMMAVFSEVRNLTASNVGHAQVLSTYVAHCVLRPDRAVQNVPAEGPHGVQLVQNRPTGERWHLLSLLHSTIYNNLRFAIWTATDKVDERMCRPLCLGVNNDAIYLYINPNVDEAQLSFVGQLVLRTARPLAGDRQSVSFQALRQALVRMDETEDASIFGLLRARQRDVIQGEVSGPLWATLGLEWSEQLFLTPEQAIALRDTNVVNQLAFSHNLETLTRELSKFPLAHTLQSMSKQLESDLKSGAALRLNNPSHNFCGPLLNKNVTAIPINTREAHHVAAFLGLSSRTKVHSKDFRSVDGVDVSLGSPSFSQAAAWGSEAVVMWEFVPFSDPSRQHGRSRPITKKRVKMSFPYSVHVSPPVVTLQPGDRSRLESVDPGVRKAATVGVSWPVDNGQMAFEVHTIGVRVFSPATPVRFMEQEPGAAPQQAAHVLPATNVNGSRSQVADLEVSIRVLQSKKDQLRDLRAKLGGKPRGYAQQKKKETTSAASEVPEDGKDFLVTEEDDLVVAESKRLAQEIDQEYQRRVADAKAKRAQRQEDFEAEARRKWQASERSRAEKGHPTRSFLSWLRVKTKRIARRLKWLRQRLRDAMRTLKRKWAKLLVERAGEGGAIVTPKLNFHSFRRISRRVRRVMQLLGHCSFVDNQLTYACRRAGVLLIITDECYTTKNCPRCFKDNNHVGASEVFECQACGYKADRDGKATAALQQRLRVLLERKR